MQKMRQQTNMRQLKIKKSITNRENASFERYLQEIGREELLTVEQEVELAQRIKKGDSKALEKLTKANLRFVVSVAKQYQNHGLSLQDLINEGNVGLIKAAEKYDETRGFKFISYAVWWIRQSIQQAIAEKSNLIKMPINQVETLNKITHASNKFEQEHGRRPSLDEMAENLNIEEDKIEDIVKASRRHVSADAPIGSGEGNSLFDVIASDEETQADRELVTESLREEICRMLNVLNDRERIVITSFFGINQAEQTMAEIAIKCNLTRERVRQIKEKAIRKLRNNTRNKLLKSYLGR